jgi:hypothetical protein
MKVGGVKTHIYFKASENMWHFIIFHENIFHISLKQKNVLLIFTLHWQPVIRLKFGSKVINSNIFEVLIYNVQLKI